MAACCALLCERAGGQAVQSGKFGEEGAPSVFSLHNQLVTPGFKFGMIFASP